MKIIKSVKSVFAAAGLSLLSGGMAQAEPFITVDHSKSVLLRGGVAQKRVDCASLVSFEDKPERLFMTCDFAQQVDSNSQKICSNTDNMPDDEHLQKNELSMAMYLGFTHFGRKHRDCIKQAGMLDTRLGKDADKIYGKGWEDKSSCSLIRAKDACEHELGID